MSQTIPKIHLAIKEKKIFNKDLHNTSHIIFTSHAFWEVLHSLGLWVGLGSEYAELNTHCTSQQLHVDLYLHIAPWGKSFPGELRSPKGPQTCRFLSLIVLISRSAWDNFHTVLSNVTCTPQCKILCCSFLLSVFISDDHMSTLFLFYSKCFLMLIPRFMNITEIKRMDTVFKSRFQCLWTIGR